MFHHHILGLDENETLRKVYEKQKNEPTKEDWFQFLKKDFTFIEEDMNEEDIKSYSKEEYKKKVKILVKKAALKYLLNQKEGHKKIKDITFNEYKIQPYLNSNMFNNEERKLLYSLRSRCHPAKLNFRKMNKNNLFCSLGCNELEDQIHIFEKCNKLKLDNKSPPYENIFMGINEQKKVITDMIQIEKKRKELLGNNL